MKKNKNKQTNEHDKKKRTKKWSIEKKKQKPMKEIKY